MNGAEPPVGFLQNFCDLTPDNVLNRLTRQTIVDAAFYLKDIIRPTPFLEMAWLNHKIQGNAFLKLENMQLTGSFKTRGIYIKLLSLSQEEKQRGIITISSGNHALGVAYHAQTMGIKATIVMPESTPFSKVESIRPYGASVILHGKNMMEAKDFCLQLIKKHHYTLIHPFNDPYIIAGQGTVGLEMLTEVPNLDVLVIPIGGGGLAAGICIAAKAINPNLHIIGVQSEVCAATAEILFPNTLPSEPCYLNKTLAEGIAIEFPGELNLAILSEHLDDCLVVPEKYIQSAIQSLINYSKLVAEGAGAIGVAGLMYASHLFQNKRVGTIVTGGNIDARVLSTVLSQNYKDHGCFIRCQIETEDSPSILGQLSHVIGKAGGHIFELSQQKLLHKVPARMTFIKAVIETQNSEHAHYVFQALVSSGFMAQILEE